MTVFQVYGDDDLYEAWQYDGDSSRRGSLRPAHRPFHNNGPALVGDSVQHDRWASLNTQHITVVSVQPAGRFLGVFPRPEAKQETGTAAGATAG